MTDRDEQLQLRGFLLDLRPFLEERWHDWKHERFGPELGVQVIDEQEMPVGHTMSWGMCRFTTAFLLPLLARHFPLAGQEHQPWAGWRAASGTADFLSIDPGWNRKGRPNSTLFARDGRGGMVDVSSIWRDHCWVVRRDGLLVDLTADQFGHEEVIVCTTDDPRYLENWKKTFVIRQIADVRPRADEWLAAWDALQAAQDSVPTDEELIAAPALC